MKIFKSTAKAFLPPIHYLKDSAQTPYSLGRGITHNVREGVKSIWQSLKRAPLAIDDPNAPNMKDFDAVMQHWGMDPKHCERYLKAYTRRKWVGSLIYAGIAALCGYSQMGYLKYFLAPVFLTLACLTFITCQWRISMLRAQCFVPFLQWLRGSKR